MNIDIFKQILLDFQSRPHPRLTPRELRLDFVRDMSLCVVGARRAGKTYRTYQFIADHIAQGADPECVCRVQFNDHRLGGLTRESLSRIDEAYYALFPARQRKDSVLFVFDEIHRVAGWEDYVLYLLDEPTHRVLITGSTSRLLEGDIASGLRGKNFCRVLYPFSFSEFTRHYGAEPDVVSGVGQSHLRSLLDRYIEQGGYPGLLDLDRTMHVELLQSYWDTMLLRDVIEAHPNDNINIAVLTHFAQALMSRIGCPVTVRSIIESMQGAGLRFTAETIYRYLRFLEEPFLVFTAPIYSPSEKVRNRNYSKVYAIDWALGNAVAPAGGVDVMRRFENLVYLDLRRRGREVFYYRTRKGYEIDFIAETKTARGAELEVIQACYRIGSRDVAEREFRGLPETVRHFGLNEATVVTCDEEDEIRAEDGVIINVVPAWKWLLRS
ncbi:ATP-binding protein [Verrucomicrobiota bacterium]